LPTAKFARRSSKSEGGLLKIQPSSKRRSDFFMHYVYIIQSIEHPEEKYTGFTSNISKRLEFHNAGQVPHTSKYKPWKLINYLAFIDEEKAREFEVYLKSGSGRAFVKKHL
jgi:predicted GIY-YIG superfamily endonuclease